jgi:diguanylate cyclase (GGDEF)-like protein/PAS domain S-box-containing protein
MFLGRRSVRRGEARRMEIDEAHLHEIFESSDEAAALVSGDGRLLRVNEAFFTLFGFTSGQVEVLELDGLLPSGDDEWSPMDAVRQAASGESTSFDSVARRSDGSAVEVSVMVGPARAPGQPAAAFVLFRDDARKFLVETAFRRLEKALDTMQLGVTITDLEGRIVYTNPADARMHGWSPEELVGRDVRVLGPEALAQRLTPGEIEELGTWSRESTNVRRDGSAFPVQLMSDVVTDADNRPIGVVTTCEDITQRKLAERALRESEERYALAMRGAADGLWDWNLETGEVFYSALWREMVGLGEADVEPTIDTWLDRVHTDDRRELEIALAEQRADLFPRFHNEHRVRHTDGSWRWVLARGSAEHDPEGRAYRIAGSLTDINDRKDQEEKLAQEALYDPLTGLPNRALLNDLLKRAIARLARKPDDAFALLFIDLDRFKQINDTLGHPAGDEVLREVARRLEKSVRPGDVVTRLAGDEFCVLLDEIREDTDATRVARRILERLDKPIRLDKRAVLTGCSIGIAVSEPGMEDPREIVRNADVAMYRAKREGRSRFELFDRTMQEQVVEMIRLEGELRRAMEEGQFHLVYQPVVRLRDREVTGVEALVRWHHPERGVLPPAAFVPVAEETGVIVPLGWWILEEACAQMAEWAERFPTMPDLSVSVNLTTRQLRHPDLTQRVRDVLARTGLDPGRLRLEISENTLLDDADWNHAVLERLSEIGVRIQLDDFGTGPSSFSYLKRFDISTLKIDRSFLQDGGRPSRRAELVEAFILLARHFDIPVVAEGVEHDLLDAQLRDFRCDHGQGYLYHEPLEPEEVAALFGHGVPRT